MTAIIDAFPTYIILTLTMTYTIRDLTTYDEMLALLHLQHDIWGHQDQKMGLHPPMLMTAAKNGGVVLGAFDATTDTMIGFLFGFLGRATDGPLKLCSQTMGVSPSWQGQGIGEALKLAQRDRALALGLSLITWTFDPLEGPNAHLNLHKLGGISRTYLRDIYGGSFGNLNAGMPTDRLEVEWWITGNRTHLAQTTYNNALPIFELAAKGVERHIVNGLTNLDAPILRLDIPANIQAVKMTDMALAQDWRYQVRTAFETYFESGYIATDFVSIRDGEARHNYYLLQKTSPALLSDIGIA